MKIWDKFLSEVLSSKLLYREESRLAIKKTDCDLPHGELATLLMRELQDIKQRIFLKMDTNLTFDEVIFQMGDWDDTREDYYCKRIFVDYLPNEE